jgi:hypothetical protein
VSPPVEGTPHRRAHAAPLANTPRGTRREGPCPFFESGFRPVARLSLYGDWQHGP